MNTIGSALKEIKNCRRMINIWKGKETTSQDEQREQQRQIIAYYDALEWQAKMLISLATRERKAEQEFFAVLEPTPEITKPVAQQLELSLF